MKSLPVSEKLKRRSELTIDVFGVPDTKQKHTIRQKPDCSGTQMSSDVLTEQETLREVPKKS